MDRAELRVQKHGGVVCIYLFCSGEAPPNAEPGVHLSPVLAFALPS